MAISPLAGEPAPPGSLINPARLVTDYYSYRPDPRIAAQRVSFGTSGHRGSSLHRSFNEWHILAITQAICGYRRSTGIDGPLLIGIDTHALSQPAFATALEVLAANRVPVWMARDEYTPTPAISHSILKYNRGRSSGLADGIVITPSHNPPEDGGFKYNPPHGGPAESQITGLIQDQANAFLDHGLEGVKRVPFDEAFDAPGTRVHDFLAEYVDDLRDVIDVDVIRDSGITMGVDPLGGAGVLLASDRGKVQVESQRRERNRGSHVPLHDPRLGRPHSHGPFVALRHAPPDRPQGQIRCRLRLRHRS